LLDALAIKDVAAFGLDGVLCNVVTDAAYSGLLEVVVGEATCVRLAPQNKIRMASHLSEASKAVDRTCEWGSSSSWASGDLQSKNVGEIWRYRLSL
jgi:hypothetical protein